MSKGGDKVSFQKLLPNYADVSTTLAAKYNMEEPIRHQTTGLAPEGQVKATYKDIEEIIIPILKNNKNIRASFELMMSMISQVQSHGVLKAFEEQKLQPDILSHFAKADLQGYENVKRAILGTPDLSPEIMQKMTDLIDKMIDYVNTIFGIAINKPGELGEAVNQIDVEDFRNNLYGTVLAFIFGLVSILVREFDEEKLSRVLALGITCSEQIESYVDTIDILSDRQSLESISQSEKYYNLR